MAIASCAGLACAFLWFVWPTPYEYTRKAPDIWRVNRFTGVSELATDDGWMTKAEKDRREMARYVKGIQDRRKSAQADFDQVTFRTEGAYRLDVIGCDNPTETHFAVTAFEVKYYRTDGDRTIGEPITHQKINAGSKLAANKSNQVWLGITLPRECSTLEHFRQVVELEVWTDDGNSTGPFSRVVERDFQVHENPYMDLPSGED